jgi:hypothetical protein
MREPEGIESPRPGRPKKTPWSNGRDLDVRNVEAEGSSPFTSTLTRVDPTNAQGFLGVRRSANFPG